MVIGMTKTATAAGPRYSESLSVLVDRPTREIILGMALRSAELTGAERPKEGEEIRALLRAAIEDIEKHFSKRLFAEIRSRGAKALAERDAEVARKAAAAEDVQAPAA